MISMTTCSDEQFNCVDGFCIPLENRCDGKSDCVDETDEMDCQLINFKSSYIKDISPPPQGDEKFLKIKISMDIILVSRLDEIGQIFSTKFRMYTKWKDTRLTYLNLKRNVNLNVLKYEDQKKIWKPFIIFDNTLQTKQSIINQEESTIRILPGSEFSYKLADQYTYQKTRLFTGSENSLGNKLSLIEKCILKIMMIFSPQNCSNS